jgi:DNA-cytosine methyltransferase
MKNSNSRDTPPSYIELCAGVGGARAGLDLLKWKNLLSVEIDLRAAELHRSIFGDCQNSDLHKLDPTEIPDHEILVSGFPCQPFSSSGHRSGEQHEQGNVFQGILKIIEKKAPEICIFENVQGIISNKYGHTFGSILLSLTNIGYIVDWCLCNARWFGVPQDRKRVIAIARKETSGSSFPKDLFGNFLPSDFTEEHSMFYGILSNRKVNVKNWISGDLKNEVEARRPRIGMPRPEITTPFRSIGRAVGNTFLTASITDETSQDFGSQMAHIVSPNFSNRRKIRSARFWGHSGETKIYTKKEEISHSIGTSIGAAPLFFVEKKFVSGRGEKEALLEYSNWGREEDDGYIFRIEAQRAALLFGKECERISHAFRMSHVSETSKYRLIGNMMAPAMAKDIAKMITDKFFHVS